MYPVLGLLKTPNLKIRVKLNSLGKVLNLLFDTSCELTLEGEIFNFREILLLSI